jgi:hypothetical protein
MSLLSTSFFVGFFISALAVGYNIADAQTNERASQKDSAITYTATSGVVSQSSNTEYQGKITGDTSVPAEAMSLWYRRPAKNWVDALALGNGRLGAMVFWGIDNERI